MNDPTKNLRMIMLSLEDLEELNEHLQFCCLNYVVRCYV